MATGVHVLAILGMVDPRCDEKARQGVCQYGAPTALGVRKGGHADAKTVMLDSIPGTTARSAGPATIPVHARTAARASNETAKTATVVSVDARVWISALRGPPGNREAAQTQLHALLGAALFELDAAVKARWRACQGREIVIDEESWPAINGIPIDVLADRMQNHARGAAPREAQAPSIARGRRSAGRRHRRWK